MIVLLIRGALTSKPYSFLARPWEFKTIESVDFFDSIGSSIRFDIRGDKIIRVLPRLNENINEEWISDKIRFSVDGFRAQRVDTPLLKLSNRFTNITWSASILFLNKLFIENSKLNLSPLINISQFQQGTTVNYVEGVFSDIKNSTWLNLFMNTFFYKKNLSISNENIMIRNRYLLNFNFKNVRKLKNIALVGVNSRYDAPVFNIRLRQGVLKYGLIVSNFGYNFNSTFSNLFLGNLSTLSSFLAGNHWFSSKFFRVKSAIIFSPSLHNFLPIGFLRSKLKVFYKNLVIGSLSKYVSNVISADSGNTFFDFPKLSNTAIPNLNLFLGLPSLMNLASNARYFQIKNKYNLSIAIAHHGDSRLSSVDFVLPTSALYEKESYLISGEGRLQLSRMVLPSPKSVLDLQDSIIFLITSSFRKNSLNFIQINFILSVYFSSITSNTLLIWNFVYNFFNLVEGKKIPLSLLLKEFFSIILFPHINKSFINYSDLRIKSLFDSRELSILNRPESVFPDSTDNFYIQDEISNASFTLNSATDRLLNKSTYLSL